MKTQMGCSLAASFVLSVVGCSAGGGETTVGVTATGGAGSEAGGSGGASAAGFPGSSGGSGASLSQGGGSGSGQSVHIEQNNVVVSLVTLGCEGACADVVAVAKGGVPPYDFEWEDGSTNPARHLCPTQSTTYSVKATDAGVTTGEFRRDPRTTSTTVGANVLECPDGGQPPDPGTPEVCFANGTFAGTAQLNVFGSFDAAPWVGCASTPDVFNEKIVSTTYGAETARPGSDGDTYLHLNSSIPSESASQKLCTPLVAGRAYSLKVDLYAPIDSTVQPVPPAKLNVFGSPLACGMNELLWRSPTPTAEWQTHCFTFTPTQDLEYMMLEANFEGREGTLFIDNIVPVDSCP